MVIFDIKIDGSIVGKTGNRTFETKKPVRCKLCKQVLGNKAPVHICLNTKTATCLDCMRKNDPCCASVRNPCEKILCKIQIT